jgi:sulfur relay (sulfurtransferase) complex TusBCD TusD component (DsrE family)
MEVHMDVLNDDAAQLRATAMKADALARRAKQAADEALRVFLKYDDVASPDQTIETAKASARAAQEAWRNYVRHVALHGGHLHNC